RSREVPTVEFSNVGEIETAGHRVERTVKPQSEMEHARRIHLHVRIESECLIEKDGLKLHPAIAILIGGNVGLVPGQAETMERGVLGAVGSEKAALVAEYCQRQIGLHAREIQDQRVILHAANNRRGGRWLIVGAAPQTIQKTCDRRQRERDRV